MDTPEDKSEDIVRAVRAVFNSFAKSQINGIRTTKKSIYFAINLARKRKKDPRAMPMIMIKVSIRLFEKKLPKKIRTRVEAGKTMPSSLKVLANVGTTKANIKTPI